MSNCPCGKELTGSKYIPRQTYLKACVICGTNFETNKPNKVVCRREYCRIKLKRINAGISYRKLKKERATEGGNSICPMCRKQHFAETSHNYCRSCAIIVAKGFIPDTADFYSVVA